MKNRIKLAVFATLPVPTLGFAHHGSDVSVAGQLLHASLDPLHLGISLLIVLGIVGIVKRFSRSGKAS